jgi:hypothetical protein
LLFQAKVVVASPKMTSFKKGQLIAVLSLAIMIALIVAVPSHMVALKYAAIFALILSAINILLSHLVPSPDAQIGQRLILFASISIASLVVGVLLLRTATVVGLFLVAVSLLLNWFVIRPLGRKVRNLSAP